MTAKKRLTVRIPIKLDSVLSEKADELGMSKNSLILHILWNIANETSNSTNVKLHKF